MSLISQDQLFLCDSGDELISAKDRCDIKTDCYDLSDENNCPGKYYTICTHLHVYMPIYLYREWFYLT